MIVRARTLAVLGVDAYPVDLEVDFARQGMPAFTMVGLAEGAVRESKERVLSALKNSGFKLPPARITVNLAPADVRKEGAHYDLPLALGLLASAGVLDASRLEGVCLAGELSLTGELRPVPGMLPLAARARAEGCRAFLVARANAPEAAVVAGLAVIGLSSLAEAVGYLSGDIALEPARFEQAAPENPFFAPDYAEVKGQEHAKRAIEIAAAGNHNLLFQGPPGSGKTMLAARLPSVLPPLTFEEALEATKVHSVAGLLEPGAGLVRARPFRSPHHTISDAGLIGGGSYPRPGEVSLAHLGVLFLDELPEFKKSALEVLRQPLEDGAVTIARAAVSIRYPSRFMLVAAMNPCPCGYHGDPTHPCLCPPEAVRRYRSRLSGPLLDRIDMQVEVPAVPYKDLRGEESPVDSASMRARVVAARQRQAKRYAGSGILSNSQLSGRLLSEHCRLGETEHAFLGRAVQRLGLSARAHTRILRLARTIADLSGEEGLLTEHLMEAVGYRSLEQA